MDTLSSAKPNQKPAMEVAPPTKEDMGIESHCSFVGRQREGQPVRTPVKAALRSAHRHALSLGIPCPHKRIYGKGLPRRGEWTRLCPICKRDVPARYWREKP